MVKLFKGEVYDQFDVFFELCYWFCVVLIVINGYGQLCGQFLSTPKCLLYDISVNLCNIAHLINPVVLVVDEGTVSAGQ